MSPTYPYVGLFIASQLASMLVKSSPIRRFLFLLMATVYFRIILHTTTGNPVSDFFIALPLSISLCNASTLILLSDPQRTAFRKGQPAAARVLPFKKRLVWAVDILTNWRGINWNFEIPGLRRSDALRSAYVTSQLKWCFAQYLMYDATTFINRRNPAFWVDGERMGERGIGHQVFNALMFWLTFGSSMAMSQTLFSAVAVALRLYEPRDWPLQFGPLLHTTTVRTLWGCVSHISIRAIF